MDHERLALQGCRLRFVGVEFELFPADEIGRHWLKHVQTGKPLGHIRVAPRKSPYKWVIQFVNERGVSVVNFSSRIDQTYTLKIAAERLVTSSLRYQSWSFGYSPAAAWSKKARVEWLPFTEELTPELAESVAPTMTALFGGRNA